jgi:hypothetical protein
MTEKLTKRFTILALPGGGYFTASEELEVDLALSHFAASPEIGLSGHSKLGGKYSSYTDWENSALAQAEAFFTAKPLDTPA